MNNILVNNTDFKLILNYDNSFFFKIETLQIIPPFLAFIEYEINDNEVKVKNVIVTFTCNMLVYKGRNLLLTYPNYIFEITYDNINFNVNDNQILEIQSIGKKSFIFSRKNPIGTLKFFSFYNNNQTTSNYMENNLNSFFLNKLNDSLIEKNLIVVDTEIIINRFMKSLFNVKPENYTILNEYKLRLLNLTEYYIQTYTTKFNIMKNEYKIDILDFSVYILLTSEKDNIEMEFSFSFIETCVITPKNYIFNFDNIELNFQGIISDEELKQIIHDFFPPAFDKVYKEYFGINP